MINAWPAIAAIFAKRDLAKAGGKAIRISRMSEATKKEVNAAAAVYRLPEDCASALLEAKVQYFQRNRCIVQSWWNRSVHMESIHSS
jgi:hypothetical protein